MRASLAFGEASGDQRTLAALLTIATVVLLPLAMLDSLSGRRFQAMRANVPYNNKATSATDRSIRPFNLVGNVRKKRRTAMGSAGRSAVCREESDDEANSFGVVNGASARRFVRSISPHFNAAWIAR